MEQRYERDDQKIDWLESENRRLHYELQEKVLQIDVQKAEAEKWKSAADALGRRADIAEMNCDTLQANAKRHREERDHYREKSQEYLRLNGDWCALAGNLMQKLHDLQHTGSSPLCQQPTCKKFYEMTTPLKRVVPVPKKCESYWDGNQCELDEKHEGKHRFMGWTWLVSPPPQTCECGLLHTPEGHACGYWKPASGGLQS